MFVIFEEIDRTGIKHILFGGTPSQVIQQYQDIKELNSLCYELSTLGGQNDLRTSKKIALFLEKYYADEITEEDIINFSFCSSSHSHKVLKYCLSEEDMEDFLSFVKSDISGYNKQLLEKYEVYLTRLNNSFNSKEDYKYILKEMHKFRILKEVII